ncbi:hypothetical protein BQ8482_40030 [Mesorhizobium delmotii]|uniref:Uncharacterized protein n=1 Tax=Mesorhizobium delmotii TaxID=1631247 RepID=A0A2P9AT16_9HYPH|nr:hypothetical protein BQ8482_40030 [Mesorhizobium delmotii]
MSAVRRAKRAADESLRVHHVLEPLATTTNTIFEALRDEHGGHRQPLLEALRGLDVARTATRSIAAGLAKADSPHRAYWPTLPTADVLAVAIS